MLWRPPVDQVPNGNPDRIATRLTGTISAMPQAVATGIAFAIEGRTTGFSAEMNAVSVQEVSGAVSLGSSSALGLGSMHVNWAIVSQDAFRLRLEAGGSMISMPDSSGTSPEMPWAGKVAFGPDVGVSGHLGLLGPIGIEGHARLTPLPFPVVDTRTAVALRGGSLAVTAGWRNIEVMGDGVDAPKVRFAGPELGLALMF